jgi:predicted ATPase
MEKTLGIEHQNLYYLSSITVSNFKSLDNFSISLSRFSCLIGLNGSGKSTVLQFIGFLCQQMYGDIDGWLEERQWRGSDLHCKLNTQKNIIFKAVLSDGKSDDILWEASFNTDYKRCTAEKVSQGGLTLLSLADRKLTLYKDKEATVPPVSGQQIIFDYQGSVLSQLNESLLRHFHHSITLLKSFFLRTHSLELLSPFQLRRRSRSSQGGIGVGGEQMSAVLYDMGRAKRLEVVKLLRKVYPRLADIDVKSLTAGWKKLSIVESFLDENFTVEARHVNDGFLRLLGIVAQCMYDQGFILFDEIENGINPELVEFLLDFLVARNGQMLVTTHSPIVLNYLEDGIATKGLVFIYKRSDGRTKSVRFFDLPSMQEKLEVMGPGDVYQDTSLSQLALEADLLETFT